jgi:hypothetical protein
MKRAPFSVESKLFIFKTFQKIEDGQECGFDAYYSCLCLSSWAARYLFMPRWAQHHCALRPRLCKRCRRALTSNPPSPNSVVRSEQQEADRAACHEWAVAQTGHDPSLVFAAQRAGVPTRTIANVTRRTGTTAVGPLGGARGTSEVQRLNERYDAYLRAGQVCLEARGYQVSR